jgi:hypothetical protein
VILSETSAAPRRCSGLARTANCWSIAVTPTPTFQTSPQSSPLSSPTPEPTRQVRRRLPRRGRPGADDGRSAHLTNLPWTIDKRELSSRFGLPALRLANDFAAAALGAVTSSRRNWSRLQPAIRCHGAPRLVVGAGTGLGMAIVLPQGKARGASSPAKAGMSPSLRPTNSRRRCGHSSMRGMAASPGNGWFPAPGSPPSTNSSRDQPVPGADRRPRPG